MDTRLLWGVVICFLGVGPMDAKAASITQTPRNLITGTGQKVTLNCEQNLGHDTMYWYRQDQGQGLQLIYFSITKGDKQNGDIPEGYDVSRNEKENFDLLVQSSRVNQTSLYLCASETGRNAGAQLHFGAGTRLTVLDDLTKVTPPKVTVFQPSEEEIERKGKATLVCLATGFYPDLVELTWWVNGEETKIGVSTDPQPSKEQPQNSFSYYTLSSRLRVSAPFWRNPKNNFRCQVLFHGISENETWPSNEGKPITQNVSDQTWGRADCGVTSESYQRSIQSATIFYEILLGKALLYSLLVSILVWRTKDKKHSS